MTGRDVMWNLWHGCHRVSEGCLHCYVYRGDGARGVDSSQVRKTASFGLPLSRKRDGTYKIPAGSTVMTCFTSDFFIEDADAWRPAAWQMMKRRPDLTFFMVTKRPERIIQCLPPDWGTGYDNVEVCCTVESQRQAERRLPLFRTLPIVHKSIIAEPLLGPLDLSPWLGPWVEGVTVGGESGDEARECDFSWVLSVRDACRLSGVHFFFKQTGAHFVKDGRHYNIPRRLQQWQARRADISF
jgi:protein gp37